MRDEDLRREFFVIINLITYFNKYIFFVVGIGIALPLLEQIINIVGSCFYSILGLIIPGIVETAFRWGDLGTLKWVMWKNILIILFGLTALVSGCTVTIMDIIQILRKKNE